MKKVLLSLLLFLIPFSVKADTISYYIETNILENGTYVLFSNRAKETLESAFDIDNIEQGMFLNGIISRKQQILPALMSDME